MAVAYIDNWTQLGEDDSYVNLALSSLRQIFTFLKNLKPKITRNTEAYFWPKRHEIVEPSRFDTIEKAVKKETHKNLYNTKYNEMMREYNREPV